MLYPEVSRLVVDGFMRVYLESCYHNALFYEFKLNGLCVEYEKPLNVHYRGEIVGEFFEDLVVNNKVIIEVKAVRSLNTIMEAQLLNYLHISGYRLGFLVNFQPTTVVFKRFVV